MEECGVFDDEFLYAVMISSSPICTLLTHLVGLLTVTSSVWRYIAILVLVPGQSVFLKFISASRNKRDVIDTWDTGPAVLYRFVSAP